MSNDARARERERDLGASCGVSEVRKFRKCGSAVRYIIEFILGSHDNVDIIVTEEPNENYSTPRELFVEFVSNQKLLADCIFFLAV